MLLHVGRGKERTGDFCCCEPARWVGGADARAASVSDDQPHHHFLATQTLETKSIYDNI